MGTQVRGEREKASVVRGDQGKASGPPQTHSSQSSVSSSRVRGRTVMSQLQKGEFVMTAEKRPQSLAAELRVIAMEIQQSAKVGKKNIQPNAT